VTIRLWRFALSVLKKIPETGEYFKFDGYRFEVVDMNRTNDKLLVSRPNAASPKTMK
jgi:putative hemolysin